MKYIAIHVEKWLHGTTQVELEFDEQAVFVRILCRAGLHNADPPGQIYYLSEEHLSVQLNVPIELLKRTLEKCKKFKKIKIKSLKRENKFVLSLPKWDTYQHFNFHQKAYRQRKKAEKEAQKEATKQGSQKYSQVISSDKQLSKKRGEEKRKENTIGEEKRGEENTKNDSEDSNLSEVETSSSPPASNSNPKEFSEGERNSSTLREEGIPGAVWSKFSTMLNDCRGYPFDEGQDYHFLGYLRDQYPDVDILAETKKKIEWWKQRPTALAEFKDKTPRDQLEDWFKKKREFQISDSNQPF